MRGGDAGDEVGEQGHGREATTRDRYGLLSAHRRPVKNREEDSDQGDSAVRRAAGQGALPAGRLQADSEKKTLSEVLCWPGRGG